MNNKFVYVVKSYMADKGNPKYRRFDTRFFVSEKKAKQFQKDGIGYRGSARPKYSHASVDIEIYELKKIIKGKRTKRFYDTQYWYIGNKGIVITPEGKKAGVGGCKNEN